MKRISQIKGYIPYDKVGYKKGSQPIVVERESRFVITDRSRDVLERARQCYESMEHLRKRRRRSRKYYRGDQWSDKIEYCGKMITEEEYIKMQGKPALKQNLIRPPVRNIIGQYRSSPFKSTIYARSKDSQKGVDMMSVALESAYEINDGRERDSRALEEFLVSGAPIYETGYSYDHERMESVPRFRAVSLGRFFTSTNASDVCSKDVDFVGEFVDVAPDEVIHSYARDEVEEQELKDIYGNWRRSDFAREAYTADNTDTLTFSIPIDGLWRVYKCCALEGRWVLDAHDWLDGTRKMYDYSKKYELDNEIAAREAESARLGIVIPQIEYRKKYIREWVYYHLSPWGHILFKKRNPYEHKSHPYVFKFYPLIDGEVWSLVEDLIDQQRMVNRMIILQDFVISASAKGVLLVPEESIPDDMDLEDIADEWARYNGVIKIKTKNGVEMPKQVIASNFNVGINDMINLEISLMKEIGGVHDALMGHKAASGTSAARYKQETQNSSLNAVDYLESFGWMLIKRDWKLVQIIKQYYTEARYIPLAGEEYSEEAKNYDPEIIRNLDFYNTMAKGEDNLTMRFISEDSLMRLLEMKLLDIETYLQCSQQPYSDKLLRTIQEQKKAMAEGNVDPNQMAAMLSQIQQETPVSNPQGLNNARGLLNGTIA